MTTALSLFLPIEWSPASYSRNLGSLWPLVVLLAALALALGITWSSARRRRQ
jgi:hypothetical protein